MHFEYVINSTIALAGKLFIWKSFYIPAHLYKGLGIEIHQDFQHGWKLKFLLNLLSQAPFAGWLCTVLK